MQSRKIDESCQGVFIICATPFHPDGRLDLSSTDSLIDFYLSKGIAGLTILGMMGEAPKLTHEEKLLFIERVLTRVAGRVPVIVGVSDFAYDQVESLAKQSMQLGAAGVMLAPIPNLKTDAQVYQYFADIFTLLGPDIPICLQDYPQVTGVYLSLAVIEKLVNHFTQLVMFKHEEMPGLKKLTQLRQLSDNQQMRRLSILVGNGGLYLPQEMLRGADGAMTGFAYPEMLVKVCQLFLQGHSEQAEDYFNHYLPLLKHEFQLGIGLALRKETLKLRGAIASSTVRKPGPQLDDIDKQELNRLIARLTHALAP